MQPLKARADFVAAASGLKVPMPAFVLQVRRRGDDGSVRVGFTVSKKVGNAVERNRVRRRLREIVRSQVPGRMLTGHDYVLVGRRAALERPFDRMAAEFGSALQRAHTNDGPAMGVGTGRAIRARRGPGETG
jgi:ribonuclease P protein component